MSIEEQREKIPQTIICKICSKPFLWDIGEQAFYKDRNLDPPKRCKDCRVKKVKIDKPG